MYEYESMEKTLKINVFKNQYSFENTSAMEARIFMKSKTSTHFKKGLNLYLTQMFSNSKMSEFDPRMGDCIFQDILIFITLNQ